MAQEQEQQQAAELVVVDFEQLNGEGSLEELIEKAYGEGGYGVMGIRNVPGFVEAKKAVLTKAHKLAHLPQETLEKLEDPASLYNAGWSHGKEKLGDKPDTAKGSFYFNPLTDTPGTPEEREKYPVFYPQNIWPKEDIPQLEPAAKELGKIMHGVSIALSKHIDTFASKKVESYKPILADAMSNTQKAKGRLLYYFPLDTEAVKEASADSWIGWHNDSGFLTCLAGDMYLDDETGEQIDCPDPKAGLYVVGRDGSDVKVTIPEDCMAIQLGECVQIITGGCVQATPHCVRGASPVAGSTVKVARVSHPVFIDTAPHFELKVADGTSREDVLKSAVSTKVPALGKRWTSDGQTFGDFLQTTFQEYYNAATGKA